MTRTSMLVLALLPGLAATTVAAQSAEEQSAYVAMIYTPVAGLPPLPPLLDLVSGARNSGVVVHGRYGHLSRRGGLTLTSLGGGVEMPRGRWRLGGTMAYLNASCGLDWAGTNDCAGDVMFGASARTVLTERPLDASAPRSRRGDGGTFLLGFEGSTGFSPRQGEQALAASASLPAALSFTSGDVRVMPFLSPGLGYGRLSNVQFEQDESVTSHGSFMLMVGGGLALQFTGPGIGASLAFQRVFKSDGGATQLGLGFTWAGLAARR